MKTSDQPLPLLPDDATGAVVPSLLTNEQITEASALKALSCAAQQGEQQRIEVGRRLLEVRPSWPKSGRNAGGWQQFLEAVGIEKRTAQRYMRAASAAGKIRDNVSRKQLPLVERVLKLVRKLPANDRERVLDELQQVAQPTLRNDLVAGG